MGKIAAKAVHFKLPVSFFIVIKVVEHGQCISENITIQMAVVMFQPLSVKSVLSCNKLSYSVNVPVAV